jgi:patatin-like phospholipase/acyl hydrolase
MKGLTLDGGGLYGLVQAMILDKAKPEDIDKFDFFAGTSIGAVLACGLSAGIPREALRDFFLERGPSIFKGYKWRRFKPVTPRFPDRRLNRALKDALPGYFGDVSKPTFITTVDLDKREPRVLYSGNPEHARMPLWEVARSAVAAETYFKPWKGLADGGIMANNPSMVGLAGVSAHFNIHPHDVSILSIGTGKEHTNKSVGSTVGWTHRRWGLYIIRATLNGAADKMHDYFVWSLPLEKYVRIEFDRDGGRDMDDPRTLKWIADNWQEDIERAVKQLEAF